jgi:hypothetical protein
VLNLSKESKINVYSTGQIFSKLLGGGATLIVQKNCPPHMFVEESLGFVFREKATMILLEKITSSTSTTGTFSSGNLGATRGSGVVIPSLVVTLPTILELILLMNYNYLFISCSIVLNYNIHML